MSKLYKNASQSNFYQSQTVPKFRPQPTVPALPQYNDWLGSQDGNNLLNALKQENVHLKEHNKTIEGYLRNVTKVFDSLNTENHNLRREIESRTYDLQRVIESTTTNQSLNEQDLQHQIELYEEELRIISAHLGEVRGGDNVIQGQLEEKNQQLSKAKELISQLEKNLNSMYQREKDAINEVAIKNLKNQELTDLYNDLNRKSKPLEEKIKQLHTQNGLLTQRVSQLEDSKKRLEDEDSQKFQELHKQHYVHKTDLEHLKHLCSQQEIVIKELKQELGALKGENYGQQISQLEFQLKNAQKEITLEQSRQKNAQQREQQNYTLYQNTKLQLDELQNKYDLLLMDYEKLKSDNEKDVHELQKKQQKNLEFLKNNHSQQVTDLNQDIARLESKIKELNLQIDQLQKDVNFKDKQLQEMRQLELSLENSKRDAIDLKSQITQKEHKFELQTTQLNDQIGSLKKKLQDQEERYGNLQEAFKKEQEKNDQLFKNNEQLRWYQEQYDELVNKYQDMKLERDNFKIEISTYQSKINQIEMQNDELRQKSSNNEQEVNNLNIQLRQLDKKTAEIELLKQENKLLRDNNKYFENLANQTTTHQRSSTGSKHEQQESNTKQPANIYTRGFNVASNKTLTTQPSNKQFKPVYQEPQSDGLKNYPYRTYAKYY